MDNPVHSKTVDVAVIGGGASGLACAIACAQERRAAGLPALRIVVLEADRRVGASIMRSGNGRCNFSNSQLEVSRYWGSDLVRRASEALPATGSSVLPWFADLGLEWRETPSSGSLLYPFSNRAESVLDVLLRAAHSLGLVIRTGTRVVGVSSASEAFELNLEVTHFEEKGPRHRLRACGSYDECLHAKRVVCACGGGFEEDMLSGLRRCFELVPRRPVLGPLCAQGPSGESCAPLDGIRAQVCLSVPARGFAEEGEVLFRPYGVSGIVVFNASRVTHSGDAMVLDFVPDRGLQELTRQLIHRVRRLEKHHAGTFLDGFLARPLGAAVLERAGIVGNYQVSEDDAARIAAAAKGFVLTVGAIADPRACQVHRGGIAIEALDASTCALRGVPGIFAVGEAVDVDGPCGGYNLHWAWTSGLLAGRACAHFTKEGS